MSYSEHESTCELTFLFLVWFCHLSVNKERLILFQGNEIIQRLQSELRNYKSKVKDCVTFFLSSRTSNKLMLLFKLFLATEESK